MGTKKLAVEIELSEAEAERFERYVGEGCYDRGKLLRKWIMGTLDRIEKNTRLSAPWEGGLQKAV